jgi:hypothetical protein
VNNMHCIASSLNMIRHRFLSQRNVFAPVVPDVLAK